MIVQYHDILTKLLHTSRSRVGITRYITILLSWPQMQIYALVTLNQYGGGSKGTHQHFLYMRQRPRHILN